MQNLTEIGLPVLGEQTGEVLVFFLTRTHTNKFFHLAYRSQMWIECNDLMLIHVVSGADVPFWDLNDDQSRLAVQTPKNEILG